MSNSSPSSWLSVFSTPQWWEEAPPSLPQAWVWSIAASIVIGMAGIAPLLIIPKDSTRDFTSKESSCSLQLLLSFAVGGLLGDVFLHLLPEAWQAAVEGSPTPEEGFTLVGQCVLCGILVFIVVEMLATAGEGGDDEEDQVEERSTNNNVMEKKKTEEKRKIKIVGYLNLLANGIDNFTHGLAVAGSFMLSQKTGVLTTCAILIHEVPHEIGDFAILLSSGFTRWEAAKAQLYTAFIGLLGALFTLTLGSSSVVDDINLYILGFTAGAFLNISLVSILPQLLKERRVLPSLAQIGCLVLGIYVMAAVAC